MDTDATRPSQVSDAHLTADLEVAQLRLLRRDGRVNAVRRRLLDADTVRLDDLVARLHALTGDALRDHAERHGRPLERDALCVCAAAPARTRGLLRDALDLVTGSSPARTDHRPLRRARLAAGLLELDHVLHRLGRVPAPATPAAPAA